MIKRKAQQRNERHEIITNNEQVLGVIFRIFASNTYMYTIMLFTPFAFHTRLASRVFGDEL